MPDLTLYGDANFESPWGFHVMVALDELGLPYKLVPLKFPIADDIRAELRRHAYLGKSPCLAHGDIWLTESSAISEFLAETYAPPDHPSLLPADRVERARARQVMSWLRTSLGGLREDRPTSSVFKNPVSNPLSDKGRRDADELIRVAGELVPAGRESIASTWSIADADLSLTLMRLVANGEPTVPSRIADYARATWARPSVQKYLSLVPA
ncbi:MAG: glutathione transferase [Kofleriaceae bacterium]|nr:glutathione transferase [Kofleriaceae bacterium]